MGWVISIVLIALGFFVVGCWRVWKLFRIDKDEFRNVLLMRYCGTISDTEIDVRAAPQTAGRPAAADIDRLIAYLERMVDRELNKARGILPFNSLVMTVLSIEINRLHFSWNDTNQNHVMFLCISYSVMLLLIISSMFCLNLFLIHWGNSEEYTFSKEIKGTIKVLKNRAIVLETAVWISIASLFIGGVVVAMGEAHFEPSLAATKSNAANPTLSPPVGKEAHPLPPMEPSPPAAPEVVGRHALDDKDGAACTDPQHAAEVFLEAQQMRFGK